MFFSGRKTLLPALLLMFLIGAVAVIASTASASTDVDSDVTVSSTWNAAGSPYIIKTNVVVQNGVTLTINSGVEVKFDGVFYLEAAATGKIVAKGLPDEPINFTSNMATPVIGDWNYVTTGSGGTFEYCNFTYASTGLYVDGGAKVTNCEWKNDATGIWVRGDGAVVGYSKLWGHTVGIAIRDANNAKVEYTKVENCEQGINFLGTTQNSLVENCEVISSSVHGIGMDATGGNNRVRDTNVSRSPTGIFITSLQAPTALGGILIYNCTIDGASTVGINLDNVHAVNTVKIQRSRAWNGNVGFYALTSGNFEVTESTFKDNNKGARVEDCLSYTATMHRNNFIKNNVEAESINSEVLWDFAGFGNFWWRAVYEYGFTDGNGDGIADREWSLTGTQKDNYPLMVPVDYADPVANAGDDIKIRQHRKLDLDGTKSTDDTWIANYTWTVDLPDEDIVEYGAKPSFFVDDAGVFIVTLRVADALGHFDTDTMVLNVTDADAPKFEAINIPGTIGAGTTTVFSANITDNIGVVQAWVTYRFGLAGQNIRLDLDHKVNNVWEGSVFIPESIHQKLYYSITAKDAENNILRSQEREVAVADITPPMLTPDNIINVTTGDFNWINATIIDNRQVQSATIEYWFGEDGAHFMLNLSMMGVLWVTEVDVPRDAASPMHIVWNATDLAGNSNVTFEYEVPVVDNDPPVVNLDRSTTKFHKSELALIKATINDNIGIEVAYVEVKYPPETIYESFPLTFSDDTWSTMITVKSTGVRIYYHFRVRDTSGNVVVTEDVERLMLSQRPEIVTVPEPNAYENEEYKVDFMAEDPDNMDYEHEWRMETNASWLSIDAVEGIISGTPGDAHVGWYWINVSVRDPDGVDDWLVFELTVHDVNAPPTVTIVSPADEQKVGTILKVSGRAEDDLDQIVWVKVRIDDGEWMDVTGTRIWSYEVSIKDLKPGMHFVDAKSYDGISESRLTEVAFIVPERDEPDENPGFGSFIGILAIAAALVVMTFARSRRT
jgi:hypothetical protein